MLKQIGERSFVFVGVRRTVRNRYGVAFLSSTSSNTSPIAKYEGMVDRGELKKDRAQMRVVREFERLYERLGSHEFVERTSLAEKRRKMAEEKARVEAAKEEFMNDVSDKVNLSLSFVRGAFSRAVSALGVNGNVEKTYVGKDGGELVLTKAELSRRPDLVAVDGKLYNLDKFASKHPGGPVINQVGGTDATAIFHKLHTEAMIKRGRRMLEQFYVGTLIDGENMSQKEDANDLSSSSPRGLYIWGSPGCGKTFLCDLFFTELPVTKSRRLNFHQFMINVHRRLHKLKQDTQTSKHGGDLLARVADEIAEECQVLFFDEFLVTDVADAMLMQELFQGLWENGVVVIATSNRHPTELYKNGIQRHLFLPFIDQLQDHCKVVQLKSERDYRLETMNTLANVNVDASAEKFYIVRRDGKTNKKEYEALWERFTNGEENVQAGKKALTVDGRGVDIDRIDEDRRVARLAFNDLCGDDVDQPWGTADYLALAENFDVVFIDSLPQLEIDNVDVVRRFISCIDIFYDAKTIVVIDAMVPINQLLDTKGFDDENAAASILRRKTDIMGDEYMAQTVHDLDQPAETSYHVHADQETLDERFAFSRAVSRLNEMQHQAYIDQKKKKQRN